MFKIITLFYIYTFAINAVFGIENFEYSKNALSNRIIDGFEANCYQFPWHVSVKMIVPVINRATFCGGSIIANNWILTAGHCVDGFLWHIIGIGSIYLDKPSIKMNSTVSILHPNYNSTNLNNDVGLIKLPKKLLFTLKIQPVRLPKFSQIKSELAGLLVVSAGWGKVHDNSTAPAPILQWTYLKTIKNSVCAALYDPGDVINSTICAVGGKRATQSTCRGDSGGQVLLKESGIYTQIGIISFGSFDGCEFGHPTGHTRLPFYLKWIQNKTGIYIRP